MPDLRIPTSYVPAFEELAKLDSDATDKLVNSIASVEVFRPDADIREAVVAPGVVGRPNLLTDAISGLLGVIEDRDKESLAETAEFLAQSEQLDLEEPERERLETSLRRLLSLDPLLTSAKAASVVVEGERLLVGCHIMTDIRPIFGMDVDADPQGAALRHTLKMDYLNAEGERTALFFVLDDFDLDDLDATITRARHKSQALKGFLSARDISVFELKGDSHDDD